MDRKNLVTRYFQKKDELVSSNSFYANHIMELFHWMLKADEINNDITSQFLSLQGEGRMQIIAKQKGILAGIEEIAYLLKQEKDITFSPLLSDGSHIIKADVLVEITGDNRKMLAFERTILNIIGRMSGIATDTNKIIQSIQNISNMPCIAATRKTPLMLLDKKAVAIGGGFTHRLSLSDEVLIKDNHLKILQKELGISIEEVITNVIKKMMRSSTEFFELEVETLTQADVAIKTFTSQLANNKIIMALLLDNFQPENATQFVQELKKNSFYDTILLEASGEINESNLSDWAKTGVDILSLGALTHSVKNFNLSMMI